MVREIEFNRYPWGRVRPSTKRKNPPKPNRPYILIFSDRLNFTWNLEPLYHGLEKHNDFDVTMVCLKSGRTIGCPGNHQSVPYCKNLNRQPNVIVTNHAWWDEGYKMCLWAQARKIPVVAIEHGCTMFKQDRAKYRRSIGAARVKCLWSVHNFEVMKQYNPANAKVCVVTGNPRYDTLHNFKPKDLDLPDEFALVLSTWSVQKDTARRHANAISELLPVYVKVHPNETHYPDKNPRRIVNDEIKLVYEQDKLFTLMNKCQFVVSTISSAMIPALLWRKPVYIVNRSQKGMAIEEFKDKFFTSFNFKNSPKWKQDEWLYAKKPGPEIFEHFGHLNDGKNTERVITIIRNLL